MLNQERFRGWEVHDAGGGTHPLCQSPLAEAARLL
jgi:hypothetical protein